MTGAGIANFLVKATGPSILVSELRLKTKILGAFLNNIDSINTLQATIPENVLEGGLSGLMSKRLQQLLDYSKQTGKPANRASANRPVFPNTTVPVENIKENESFLSPGNQGGPGKPFSSIVEGSTGSTDGTIFSAAQVPGEDLKENKSSLSPGLAEAANKRLVSKESDPGIKNELFDSAPLPDEDKERGSSLQAQFQRAMQRLRVSMPTMTGSNGKPPAKEMSTGVYEQEGKAPGSIFVQELNKYLHMSQAEQSSGPGANRLPAVDRVKGRQGKAPSFSLAAEETGRANSLPGMTEDEIAREINAFMKGGSDLSIDGNTHKDFSPGDPGKVRIHNTFNIKVGSDGQRETGTPGSLAEKIAVILGEQALQHGIDIT
jgi:hypothetical protein